MAKEHIHTAPINTDNSVVHVGGVGGVSCRVEVGKGRGNWETSVIVSTLKTKEKDKKENLCWSFLVKVTKQKLTLLD